MTGISPPVLFKQLITDVSLAGIGRAEDRLKDVLVSAMPSLVFKGRLRASQNDVAEPPETMEVRSHGAYFFLTYCGTRRPGLGAYLLARISLPRDMSSKHQWALHAHELPFIQSVITSASQIEGFVTVGQTRADARSLVVVSGKRLDVFSYLLASRAGLDRLYAKPGEEQKQEIFLWKDLAEVFRDMPSSDESVNVSGWAAARFLRGCFRQLPAAITQRAFDERFGRQGVYWRPRSPFRWGRS